jgi:shikimate dehydrogenase
MNCIGGAISKDIKHSIIPFLNELDPIAQLVDSVNTVVVQTDGSLKGYNSDAIGFKTAVEKAIKLSSKPVKTAVIYGYGGVTSVCVSVLKSLNINVYIAGRRSDECVRRAEAMKVLPYDITACPAGFAELFINATPVTDKPLHETIGFLEALNGCSVVFDHEMPGDKLLEHCRAHGIAHVSGYDMYYPQMYAQWALFLRNYEIDENQIPDLIKQAESK